MTSAERLSFVVGKERINERLGQHSKKISSMKGSRLGKHF
jgi:hypothetical protein